MGYNFSSNRDMNFHITRALAEASLGGGDFFEILYTGTSIKPGDFEDWYQKWRKIAIKTRTDALEAETEKMFTTAQYRFLSASNYFRLAMFFCGPEDPRMKENYLEHVQCFQSAGRYFTPPLERVKIPFEGEEFECYFFPALENKETNSPAVLFVPGADVTKEELYFLGVNEMRKRGMSVLCFEGSGQGANLRLGNSKIRYDYEKPARLALDFLQSRKYVDPNRIGIVGRSFAGYYATRVAALDSRIRACVIWGALYNAAQDIFDVYPTIRDHLTWQTGAKDHEQAREKLDKFTLDELAPRVNCPILIMHGEDDFLVPVSAAKKLYSVLTNSDKELRVYPSGQPGSVHCQYDNFADAIPYMCDWLYSKLTRVV